MLVVPVVDRAVGRGGFRQGGAVVAREGQGCRATEAERGDIGVRGQCDRSIPVVERFSKLPQPPEEPGAGRQRPGEHAADPRIPGGSRPCPIEAIEGTSEESSRLVSLTSPAQRVRQVGIQGGRVGEVHDEVRIVALLRFGERHRLPQARLAVTIATDFRIHPDVEADHGREVGAAIGHFGVGCDQGAEDRFGAVQVRQGTIGFADVPGDLRVAEQLGGESLRCGMILGVGPEDLLGLAHRASSQVQGRRGRPALELHVGEQTEAVDQVHPVNHVRSDVQQALEVGSPLLELGPRDREITGPELELTEDRMVGAHAFEIIRGVGAFLDLLVLDRQGLANPGDRFIQGTAVQMGRPQVAVTRPEVAQEQLPARIVGRCGRDQPLAQGGRFGERLHARFRLARRAEQDGKVVERCGVLVQDIEIIGVFADEGRADRGGRR